MKLKIEESDIKDIAAVMHDWYGLKLTNQFIKALLKENENIVAEIFANGIDTCTREVISDAIVKKLVGHLPGPKHKENSKWSEPSWTWPLNGDPKEYKQEFDENFKKQVEMTSGISLTENWGMA